MARSSQNHARSFDTFSGMICLVLAFVFLAACSCVVAGDSIADAPQTPHIQSIDILESQPHENDPSTIWYDDFDDDSKQEQYPEKNGETTREQHFGAIGKSLRMYYPKGKHGIGNRKVFFGDSPTHLAKTVRRNETFEDIYWRIGQRVRQTELDDCADSEIAFV